MILRIMTFNTQHTLDYKNRVIDIDLFINSIKKHCADICCLNEVIDECPIEGYTDRTKAIADGLRYERYFGEAVKVCDTSP